MLASRHFRSWEGAYELHHSWVEVQQKLGDLALDRGEIHEARRHYELAFEYPRNLEVASRTPDLRAHVLWSLARAHDGEEKAAVLKRILEEDYPRPALGSYYKALALEALDRTKEASQVLDQLEDTARARAARAANERDRSVAHYLLSLVLREKGNAAGADAERRRAFELDPRPDRRALTQAQVEYAAARQ